MRAAVLFEQGRPQRVEEVTLEDANEAFRALAAGGLGRGVIVF
jgi:Zn-dependent alcohol dehydrogenase